MAVERHRHRKSLTAGITQPEDEGAPARIFQLLMLLQVPAIAFFAAKWLPRCPRPVILVLLLQVGLALSAVAVVILLESGVFF